MDAEFDDVAAATAADLAAAELDVRMIAACRGSANPASLAWLAEGTGLGARDQLVDLGSGLGGPVAWFARRFGCRVLAVEPAGGAAAGAASLFGIPVVRGDAARAPVRSGLAHTVTVLGVLSVSDDPPAVLAEAARIGPHVGVLDFVAAAGDAVSAGGSRFPAAVELHRWCRDAGLQLRAAHDQPLPAPPRWKEIGDRLGRLDPEPGDAALEAAARSEAEVVRCIEEGRLVAHVLLARTGP